MNSNRLLIPLAIVIAGGLIAGALYFSGKSTTPPDLVQGPDGAETEILQEVLTIRGEESGDNRDHILGDADAKVVIIEYSDFQCPFCKDFHVTMERIMNEFNSGEVAWVYRHLWPRQTQYHPLAGKAAEASECVAELGGNEAFWSFASKLFEGQPTSLEEANLTRLATQEGVDQEAFNTCLSSGKYAEKVDRQTEQARSIGVTGTPFSVVAAEGTILQPIQGAQPYESVRAQIQAALDALD